MPLTYQHALIDRFTYAAGLAKGRRVLDIGGQHPMNHDVNNPFARSYRRIMDASAEYECFDRDAKPNVKYAGDLNAPEGQKLLSDVLQDYRPQVVLCMEILEHVNHPHAVMNLLAAYQKQEPEAEIFITLPNNGNWIINALDWHRDHSVAFFKSIVKRFIERSDLGQSNIKMYPCMQTYKWFWRILYVAAFCQPINWGFHIVSHKQEE